MNELKKRLTKFFYEATRVKSYIDFSGENYQKAKDSELSSGRINSLATNEFWVENKPSDTKKDKLEVILIPKVLADGLIDLGVDVLMFVNIWTLLCNISAIICWIRCAAM